MKKGAALFSISPIDDAAIQACRDYVKTNNYTRDDVKIIKLEGSILVVLVRDL